MSLCFLAAARIFLFFPSSFRTRLNNYNITPAASAATVDQDEKGKNMYENK